MEKTWMESTKRKDAATPTWEGDGVKEGKVTKDEALEKKAENARELGLDYEPQRTWVGLTDEEIDQICGDVGYGYIDVAKAIEAKLKEKNTWATLI